MAITVAGERLLESLSPAFGMITNALETLNHLRDTVAGTIRVTASLHAAQRVLWPVVARMLESHSEIHVEISADSALTNIIDDHFDAGVRLGQQVEQDMVAMRISPDLRLIVVASPHYLAKHGEPQTPHDLLGHSCINIRLPTAGTLYSWEFQRDGRDLKVRVNGSLTFNSSLLVLQAAVEGCGMSIVFEDLAMPYINDGRLVQVLDDWCSYFSGYHLYYPSRRQHSPAFKVFLKALRTSTA